MLKTPYFQRKYKEKYSFPLFIQTFLLYPQRILSKQILQHVPQIKAALGIAGVQTNVCSWFSRGTEERRGAQIDLVMQRADGLTDLCEMKHSTNVFTIDRDYATNLQNKIEAYQELSKDKRTLHLVMVTMNGVVHNNYYNIIQNEVTMDDLFAR